MPILLALLTLLVIVLIIGALMGWHSFFKIRKLAAIVAQLRHETNTRATHSSVQEAAAQEKASELNPSTMKNEVQTQSPHKVESWIVPTELAVASRASAAPASSSLSNQTPSSSSGFTEKFKDNWMTWLGGLSIALGGVFLVAYSIEQGYLGPTARIIMAVITGLTLHSAAEWLRRNNVGHYHAFAALAGGASITLYAALLAALHLYQLLPPVLVFALLAVVSLATMALAVLHGPILATMGILGAYVVPLLVDTGSDNVASLLIYAMIISCAAMGLMHFVYRYWLWVGMLVGALGWWFVSILTPGAEPYHGVYLAALVYLITAAPLKDWFLSKSDPQPRNEGKSAGWRTSDDLADAPVRTSLLWLMLAFALSILARSAIGNGLLLWAPMVVLVFLVSKHRHSLRWLPWTSLAVQCLAFFTLALGFDDGVALIGLAGADQNSLLIYAASMAAIFPALSFWILRSGENRAIWISLALVAPLLWLALCYLLVPGFAQSWLWSASAFTLGLVYIQFAAWHLKRGGDEPDIDATVWLILAGHFAYSLAVAIMFQQAGLTLALAVQLISLAWVIKRFELPRLSVLVKLVLAVVVLRLTTNPWLLTYPIEVHWSLWSYGGATLCCVAACWLMKDNLSLRRWLEMAALHLFVLTLWAETRFWLYDGNIFSAQVELLEVAINTALCLSLALIYYLRSGVSESLKLFYIVASRVLLVLGAASYMLMILALNPLFVFDDGISAKPLFNLLLLAYGFPVLIGFVLYRYYDPVFKKAILITGGLAGFFFINIEIRHLWQGVLDINASTSNGELYSYSIVWLVASILLLLAAGVRLGIEVYRVGMALLLLVIGKIFLVDMADLDGLLRVASFMGLGLSLLGLAYLYQRFNLRSRLQPDKELGQNITETD